MSSASDRTLQAILDAAARVLAERSQATIADIADSAGLGRTTVYRYFPTRELLLVSLTNQAIAESGGRLAEAHLDGCSFEEGVGRAIRALLTVGDRYVFLSNEPKARDQDYWEREVGSRLRRLIERGRQSGALREDVQPAVAFELLRGAVTSGVRLRTDHGLGLEEASAEVTRLFLGGVVKTSTGRRAVQRRT